MDSTSPDGVSTVDGPPARSLLLQENQSFGDYRIVRLLGRGGMGEVYEVDDLVNGRRVALKVVNVARSSPVALQRFLREGELAASLSHPNTVYVFASGEIDGIPYIVTELVSGGTLADRVTGSGPLPVSRAVDAILDVIAGLEAAADLGILHRDVKPSNCFAPDEGGVKIGDFGVSIPLDARERTELTLTGVIVGTPTYCAPEQLKGEQLDVRSDIYSVGATLFYLLVGHPPFRGTDIVQLIEQVLIAAPPAPHVLRTEIPRDLTRVINACLSKKREQRPPTYEALTTALMPFSSLSPTPASVAPRTLAAVIDGLVLVALWNLGSAVIQPPVAPAGISVLPVHVAMRGLVMMAYFALAEYWLGASFGKLLCGVRVGSADGTRVRIGSSLVRAAIVFVALSVPTPVRVGPTGNTLLLSPGPVGLCVALLLFVSARRSNGYSGIHELLTGTRTWETPPKRLAPLAASPSESRPSMESSDTIGPYRVVRRFERSPPLVLARDERLKRSIWLRLSSPGEVPVSAARRNLDRPQRVRWLGAKRAASEGWDAYEYVEGRPLVALETAQVPFETVARWLAALAAECQAAHADDTLAHIGLNQLWITRRGDVKVADWPLPDVEPEGDAFAPGDVRRCQQFLSAVAARVLNSSRGSRPVPLYGNTLLNALKREAFADFDDLVAACEDAADRDGTLSTSRRAAPIVAASVFAALPLVVVLLQLGQFVLFQQIFGQRAQLSVCVQQLNSLNRGMIDDESGARREAAEMCVAVASRDLGAAMISDLQRQFPDVARVISSAQAKYPQASIADLRARFANMPPFFDIGQLQPKGMARLRTAAVMTTRSVMMFGIRLLAALGAIAVVWALLLREGPIYGLLGIAVVRSDGRRVSRMRAAARAIVVWLPAFIAWAMLPSPYTADTWRIFAAGAPLIPMAAAAVYAARHPTRGVPELITKTHLVRR